MITDLGGSAVLGFAGISLQLLPLLKDAWRVAQCSSYHVEIPAGERGSSVPAPSWPAADRGGSSLVVWTGTGF